MLNGDSVARLPPHLRARAGLTRSFQSLELFDDLTVMENLQAASDTRSRLSYATNIVWPVNSALSSTVVAAIHEFQLEDDLARQPRQMSHGRRRLVAIARAVATQPSIVLLDEPAAGLDETETEELAGLLRRLAGTWGIGILLVEHDMSLVMAVCDRVVVLDFGRKIAEGTPAEISKNDQVLDAYLGRPTTQSAPQPIGMTSAAFEGQP